MSALDAWDEMNRPLSNEEWAHWYMRVISDPRFRVFGLTRGDILDVKFHLDCWKKTAQDLRKDVPSQSAGRGEGA